MSTWVWWLCVATPLMTDEKWVRRKLCKERDNHVYPSSLKAIAMITLMRRPPLHRLASSRTSSTHLSRHLHTESWYKSEYSSTRQDPAYSLLLFVSINISPHAPSPPFLLTVRQKMHHFIIQILMQAGFLTSTFAK